MIGMHSFKFITPVLLSLVLSCSPTGRISVTNVNDSGFRQPGMLLYSLPQTVLDVCVEADETEILPGPYRQYAAKYLGIQDVPSKPENSWTLKRVKIALHMETDPDFVFAAQGSFQPDVFPGLVKLMRDSMILDLSRNPTTYVSYNNVPEATPEPYFTDLSVKRNFEVEKNVEVSLVMPDSNSVSRTANKKSLREKTLEQKAEEAANFLIKLKKRRFRMVSGLNDSTPQGEAMTAALQELDRLEEAYLSLFTGKKTVYHHQRNYHYTPAIGKKTDRIVLFRFADNEGFLDALETRGKPVLFNLEGTSKTKGLEQSASFAHLEDNMILYRIPDLVNVKLIYGEDVLSESLMPVFQSGALVRMELKPVKQ
jgi:hypothetical protein